MTVGFLLTDVAELSFFKETVQKFPHFDYAAYIDTKDNTRAALVWFVQKGVTLFATRNTEMFEGSSHPVVSFDSLHAYLQEQEVHDGVGKRRDIYTTVMTKEQDLRMAELLGGFFVEE